MDKIIYSSILLFGVFISSISQVLLKISAQKKYNSKLKEYLNPFVIIGYLIFFVATFLSIVSYKKIPLSLGYIMETTSYIYVAIFGFTIFKEKFNYKKIIALCLIIGGIVVFTFF